MILYITKQLTPRPARGILSGGEKVKILIIVIFSSWTLYRAGVVHRFLDALIIPDLEPVPDPVKVAPAQPAPDPFNNISRLELEALAAAKMKALKIKHWYIIARTAPNEVLKEIIL